MNLKTKLSLSTLGKTARFVLPAAAMLLVAPAMAAEATGAMASVFEQINGITPGIKAVVAIVGFIVALVSLVALRSFSAVLFFLGLAVFGAGGLAMAQAMLGATASLI